MNVSFEPRILAFTCNWCAYQGADLAGTSRKKYAPNVRIVRVLCSGRVDPLFVLKAFEEGADGVLIAGCHPRNCHYQEGNLYAERRYHLLREIISVLGIEGERVRLMWISSSEGKKFAKTADEFTQTIRELGPLQ
jgi:F420-non-reducing hydrogenase iron-sulfur subunit